MNRTTTNIAVIEEAIQYCRLVLASPHLRHPLTFLSAVRSGDLLLRAFHITDNAEYLNESIAVHRIFASVCSETERTLDELMYLLPLGHQ